MFNTEILIPGLFYGSDLIFQARFLNFALHVFYWRQEPGQLSVSGLSLFLDIERGIKIYGFELLVDVRKSKTR